MEAASFLKLPSSKATECVTVASAPSKESYDSHDALHKTRNMTYMITTTPASLLPFIRKPPQRGRSAPGAFS